MDFYALLNFFPILFKDVFEKDPVKIGLKGIPPALSTTFGAVFTNAALSWFKGWNRELLLAACILMTAFSGALACVTPETPRTAVGLGTIAGFGVGGVSSCYPRADRLGQYSYHRIGACPCGNHCHHCHARYNNRNLRCLVSCHPSRWWVNRICHLLQCVCQQTHTTPTRIYCTVRHPGWSTRRVSRTVRWHFAYRSKIDYNRTGCDSGGP
jgi:hypothetical protein